MTEPTRAQRVRDVFATGRMQGAWARLSAAQDGDRLAALEGVRRILAAADLGLDDVLQVLTDPASALDFRSPRGRAFGGFEGIFGGMGFPAPSSSPTGSQPIDPPPARRRPAKIVQGADVPSRVYGRVRIHDERPTAKGRMLVVGVEGQDAIYDPIIAFGETDIDRLKAAAAADEVVTMRIRAPSSPRHMPSAHGVQ